MVNYMLVSFSLLSLLVLAVVAFLLALEAGYWLGWKRHHRTDEPEKSHSNALQGATLGLLALLLGFTFAMAVSRYDTRRAIIMEQANAIGTAELRSRLLGSPQTEKCAPLFRAYVQAWLDFRSAGDDFAAIKAAENRAFDIENQLWNIVRDATAADPHSLPASLFASAMNDVIDAHEKRWRSVEDRVPDTVILLLFLVSLVSIGLVAYSSGLSGRRWQVSNVTFAVLIAIVLIVILDIDRPRRGFIQVSQESMIRLQQSLNPAPTQ